MIINGCPQLLYSGRLVYMPKGEMPATQGNPNNLKEDKMQFGVSTSYNAEAEDHSSSDWRIGAEFAMVKEPFLLCSRRLLHEYAFHRNHA